MTIYDVTILTIFFFEIHILVHLRRRLLKAKGIDLEDDRPQYQNKKDRSICFFLKIGPKVNNVEIMHCSIWSI